MTADMNLDLLERVDAVLVPIVAPLAMTVVGHEERSSLDLASVTLQAGNVVARVFRERGPILLELASSATPYRFFDSAAVMEHLKVSAEGGIHGTELDRVLTGIGSFLTSFWHDLDAAFAPPGAERTNEALAAIQERRATARWGPSQGGGAV